MKKIKKAIRILFLVLIGIWFAVAIPLVFLIYYVMTENTVSEVLEDMKSYYIENYNSYVDEYLKD